MLIKKFCALTIFCGALFAPAGALAQGTCDFGAAHPDAPPEIQQFEFLIGNYRIEARVWQDDAFSQGHIEAAWNGWWGLNGWAVIDEWFGPQTSPDVPPNLGVNVRIYDSENERWNMVWQQTANTNSRVLQAEQGEDGVLRMWQVYPEPTSERFIYFEIYDDAHWARIQGVVQEDGTHLPQYRLDAFEVPCEV